VSSDLRVLIITNLYPDARLPAFGTFVAGHAEALRQAGAEVEVIAITGVPAQTAILRKYVSLFIRTITGSVRALVHRRRPQIVEAHVAYPTAILAWIAARMLRARLVVFMHGSDVTGDGADGVLRLTARSEFHRHLAGAIFRRADLLVANSGFIRGELTSRFRVDPARVMVWSPGIDYKRLAGHAPDAGRSGILFVGRLARGKGVHELIQAVAALDGEIALRFVGNGPERAALEREAIRLGVAASFDGALAPHDVARAMREAAVVAMPSTYPEGLGLVALEAMAAGAMVVATAVGGIGESVIDGETGLLVPGGDVAALAGALRAALTAAVDDPARYWAIRSRALAKAREHDVDEIAVQTLRAYELLGAG
jgi:glycosyltransferase involved in cell wall biosynthesis